MATANTNLRLEISVGTDGLVSGLKVATTGVNQATQEIKQGMSGVGESFGKANHAVEGHNNVLRGFMKEQRQHGRMARWYSNELLSIVPGAEGASGAIRSLMTLGFSGIGIGLGIELTIHALATLMEVTERAHKRLEELESVGATAGRKIAASMRDIQHGFDGPWTRTSDAMWQMEKETAAALQKIDEDVQKEAKKLSSVWNNIWQRIPGMDTTEDKIKHLLAMGEEHLEALAAAKRYSLPTRNKEADVTERQTRREAVRLEQESADEVVRIKTALMVKLEDIAHRKDLTEKQRRRLEEAETSAASYKIQRIEEARAVQVNSRIRTLNAQRGSERERIEADLENKLAEMKLRIGKDLTQKDYDRIVAAEQAAANARIAIYLEGERVRIARQMELEAEASEKEAVAAAEKHAEFTRLSVAWMKAGFDEQAAQQRAELKEQEDREIAMLERIAKFSLMTAEQVAAKKAEIEHRYAVKRTIASNALARFELDVINTMAARFQQGLTMMLSGQLSFTNAIKGLWQILGQSIAEVISQRVTAWLVGLATEAVAGKLKAVTDIATAAPVAAANAFAANVGIPVVGPAVAAGAASAAYGTVMGMVGMVPAYAGGVYQLRSDQLALLHQDEMVMTARQATGIRSLIDGDAPRGGAVHANFTIHAADGASIDRLLTSRQGKIYKLLEEAVRNGRLSR